MVVNSFLDLDRLPSVVGPPLTCYGIDIGKFEHVVAVRNRATPIKYRSRKDDVFSFSNDADGFATLLSSIREHGGPECCIVLFEPTGHYSMTLRQFLTEHRIKIYTIQPKARYGKNKSDKRDARALADIAYNQLVLQAIPADEQEHIHSRLPPTTLAKQLRGVTERLYERERRRVQLLNRLTSIMDVLFPEFARIYKTSDSASALEMRECYPTPQAIASASHADLCTMQYARYTGYLKLAELQRLAAVTVGIRDPVIVDRLVFEQRQLIDELKLVDLQIAEINDRIKPLLDESREARILMSFPGVSYTQAAILLSNFGNFDNFETAADLAGLAGWRPFTKQSGDSAGSENLRKTGNMLLKRTVALIVFSAIRHDVTWKALYERLVRDHCRYDNRLKRHVGKMKIIGRIAGQTLRVMFTLIRRDRALIARTAAGVELPEPELYEASRHIVKMK